MISRCRERNRQRKEKLATNNVEGRNIDTHQAIAADTAPVMMDGRRLGFLRIEFISELVMCVVRFDLQLCGRRPQRAVRIAVLAVLNHIRVSSCTIPCAHQD